MRSLARPSFAVMGLALLAACAQMSEAEARAALARWFVPGDSLYFKSKSTCTAAVYSLRSGAVRSALPVLGNVTDALEQMRARGVLGMGHPDGTADEAFVAVMNADRATGVALQNAAVGARSCMDDTTQGIFNQLLTTRGAVLAFDPDTGLVAIMDPGTGLVVLAGGPG